MAATSEKFRRFRNDSEFGVRFGVRSSRFAVAPTIKCKTGVLARCFLLSPVTHLENF